MNEHSESVRGGPNPYAPPRVTGGDGPEAGGRAELRRIAQGQRLINLAILFNTAVFIAAGVLGAEASTLLTMVIGLGYLATMIMSLYGTVRLAGALSGTTVAVISFILMFVPCVNLLVLLMLNGRATKRLREAGFKVGLLGADPSQFD